MVILGSTGSIGVSTLDIAEKYNLKIEVLSAGININLLNKQIAKFNPEIVVVSRKDDMEKVVCVNSEMKIFYGDDGILIAIEQAKSDLVVNALVGFAGLKPTLKAIETGKKVALANKESLVVAGEWLDISKIHPIDSEHFALWYLLSGRQVEEMTITASGGAFRNWEIENIKNALSVDALKHPNWQMGKKITVDSASMVNKLFELLEAKWLFNPQKLDAIIEQKSMLHAVVRFIDGSSTAHISNTDMRLPIAFALLGKVEQQILEPIDLLKIGELKFQEIEIDRYPVWSLKNELLENPRRGAILNSANDFIVNKFLKDEIPFGKIADSILESFNKFRDSEPRDLKDVFKLDTEIKDWLKGYLND